MSQDQIFTLIANIINGIGLFFIVLSMVFKKKKSIILCQSVNQIFSGISYLMLKGYAGLMLNVVTLIMDIFIFFDKQTKTTSIIFAVLTFVLGTVGVIISANSTYQSLNDGINTTDYIRNKMIINVIISYLPVIGTSIYNIVSLSKKLSVNILRFTFAFSCALWAIFSLYIKSYVGFAFNVAAVVAYIVKTINLAFKKENNESENDSTLDLVKEKTNETREE